MKKVLGILLAGVLMTGCSSSTAYTKSDMSGYENLKDEDHAFVDMTVQDMVNDMNANKTFAVIFSFEKCPWCQDAIPELNTAAKEYKMSVGYINTRSNSEWKSNTDIDDYDQVVELLGDYLDYDDDGVKHLYTPMVFFFKDGKVVDTHEGTVEGHDASERDMTDDETEELDNAYREGFKAMQ